MARKGTRARSVASQRHSRRSGPADFAGKHLPQVADHELLRRIGSGSYGEVWLARDVIGTYHAVKVVHRSAFADQRPFERELEGLKRFAPISLRHAGWVGILQVGQSAGDDYFYYVMEAADDVRRGRNFDPESYVPKTLGSELAVRGRLPLDECVQLGLSLVEALGHLHEAGLIHRDVKPANIIFVEQIPRLADIGLVTTPEGATSFVGTRFYAPPDCPPSPSADLYSLGKVLYQAGMGKNVEDFPEWPTDLDCTGDGERLRQLNEIIQDACDRDASKRFHSASAMAERLARLLPQGKHSAQAALATPERKPPLLDLEAEGGAVPLNSKFYIRRPADDELQAAITRRDSIILLKGARQMGKSSLLARGLEQARAQGITAVSTDLQALNDSEFESLRKFYVALANSLADGEQVKLDVLLSDVWDDRCCANTNFDRFLRREGLGKLPVHLFWALDEVDRLFTCPFGEEVFRMFRSWHNKRALDPRGPWARLTLAMAHATEASLFITDLNSSPFNVGTRLALDDFNRDQVAELNRRYGSPLTNEDELARLTRLVNGQPFLVRRALSELATHKSSLAEIEARADQDDGIFGDHLRRLLAALNKDKPLREVMRGFLSGRDGIDAASFYRLRGAGVLAGDSERSGRLRCQLYANYLQRHLL